jgi:hypothetical protein
MRDAQKRKKIRQYYQKSKFGWPVFLILAGGAGIVIGVSSYDGEPIALFGLALAGLGVLMFLSALGKSISRPGDRTIDKWFEEDLQQIHEAALKKLGLTDDLLGVKKEPLRAIGPILWPVSGVPDKDLLWKKGRDDLIRFAVNEVVMIYTAEHLLAAYGCYFDSIKNVTLNEETYEFHYQDIVSVATSETSTSYTLPNKEKLVHAQEFKVSVSSGESIDVVIDSPKLYDITKGDILYKGEVDKTVNRLRSLLRDKKQPSPPPVFAAAPPVAQDGGGPPRAVTPDGDSRGVPSAAPPEESGGRAAPSRYAAQAPAEEGMRARFCSSCGQELKPSHRFCPGCGKELRG